MLRFKFSDMPFAYKIGSSALTIQTYPKVKKTSANRLTYFKEQPDCRPHGGRDGQALPSTLQKDGRGFGCE